jgi:WD40 repeat protein
MKDYLKGICVLFAVFVIATIWYDLTPPPRSSSSKNIIPAHVFPTPELLTDFYKEFDSVLMTPDGKKILTGNTTKETTVGNVTTISGYGVQVWDAKSLKLLSTFGVQKGVSPFAITPDGEKVVVGWDGVYNKDTGNIENSHAQIYNLTTGKKILQMPTGTGTTAFSISPNGRVLALGLDKYLELRDLKTGHLIHRLHHWMDNRSVSSAFSPTFSPDGKRIAFVDNLAESVTSYANGNRDEVGIFSIQSGQRLKIFKWDNTNIRDIKYSPGGKYLAVIARKHQWSHQKKVQSFVTKNQIYLCDANTGSVEKIFCAPAHASYLAFSPNAKWLAVGSRGEGVRVWSVTNGKLMIDTAKQKLSKANRFDFVYSIAFTPDSLKLLIGAGGGVAILPIPKSQ